MPPPPDDHSFARSIGFVRHRVRPIASWVGWIVATGIACVALSALHHNPEIALVLLAAAVLMAVGTMIVDCMLEGVEAVMQLADDYHRNQRGTGR